jgi:hypothetical protein
MEPTNYYPDAQTHQVNQSAEVIKHYQGIYPSFVIPFIQAFITGFLVGLVVFSIALIGHWSKPWAYWLITWFVIQAVAWGFLLWGWRSVIYRLEVMLNLDLTGDQVVGPPKQTIRIEVSQDNGKRLQFADLEVEADQLVRVARSVLAGASFSEGSLTGYAAPLSRSQFRSLRDTFLARGWIAWKNNDAKAQGLEFTRAGLAVMRGIENMANHPTPAER